MRFQRLDLLAFGHFTDVTIDLSAGNYGLHLIFGPNEAGKSSSLRALTDFLYGIPGRTNDSFLHPYGKMRIGGTIASSDGRQLQCIRRKGHQGTLRDRDDVGVVAESELTSLIGDVDRELFCSMFGIDHTTLRRGGDELVQGAGQLGTSLFSSASGLGGLRDLQSSFSDSIDRVFKSSGRSGTLVESINEYKAKKDRQKDTQVTADAYNKHVHAKQEAADRRNKLDQEIYAMQVEKGRLERIGHSLPLIASWRSAKARLEAIGEGALLPEDFSISSSKLVTSLQKMESERSSKKTEIESIDTQLQQLPASGHILLLSARIEEVTVRSGEYLKGRRDLVRNENFLQQNEREARNILRTMGRPDDLSKVGEELRIPKSKMLHIQSLGNKYEGLVARVESSSEELDKLHRQITQNEQKLAETTVAPTVITLRAKVSQIQRQGDLETQSDQLRAELQSLASEIDGDLKRLPLWQGTADDLAALATPVIETIDRFDHDWTQYDSDIKAIRKRKSDADKQLSSLESELESLESNQFIPTESELAEKRITRDLGWSLIRKQWIEGTLDEESSKGFLAKFSGVGHLSDAYELSVSDADNVSDQLRNDADQVASKSRILIELKQQLKEIADIGIELSTALQAKADLERNWTLLWQPLGLHPLPPREMRSWLIARSALVEKVSKLNSIRRNLDSNESKIESYKTDLREELQTVGVSIPTVHRSLQEVLQIAQQKDKDLQSIEKNRQLYTDSVSRARTDAELAELAFEKAKSALTEWETEWAIEMQRMGLEPKASPDQANDVLSDVNDLFKALHEADNFRKRNIGIERDAKQFVEDVEQIAKEVDLDHTSLSVDQLISRLNSDLDTARKNDAIRSQLLQQHEAATSQLQKAETSYKTLLNQVDDLCRIAHCSNPEELPQAAELSRQRRELLGKIELLVEQIAKFAGNKSFEEFLIEVDAEAANPDSIVPRAEQLDREIRQSLESRDEAVKGIEREANALEALDRNDDVSELATECESIAATIEDRLRELAVLRVCSVVLTSGIERFREKNQDPMLLSAAAHFKAMTCEAFSGLRADLDEQGKAILVGIRALSGESVQVSQMSDGTCDQLYLALRLASLESWLQRHEPIPFVVDDILLNFDNHRALATLERLVELSSKTQVIFFTHHRHLVELAQQNIGVDKLIVHELSANQ
jgi:uncharacterized protein YhaN